MNKRMNFEDNIFILNIRIRMIQDLLILDTDGDMFFSKTLDDLDFLDRSLGSLLAGLRENTRLIERDEQFYNLAGAERQFCELLIELSHGEGNISGARYPELHEKANILRNRSLERRRAIEESIVETKRISLEPVVGYDELHELLSS
ncbi:MAG: hypothetical protein LBJ31_12110 [Treponema sp.]|jgi:hypothetical protein|nr:hypothetical protein [Treponema sp.]